jgi:hypothetical protein
LKRLDTYILAKYIKTFLLALALIIVIVITFDVSEKLDKFLGHHATFWQVAIDYYGNFIPEFVNLYSPLFIFISVIFFTSKMAGNTEIIAILSSGISYRRILRPYLYGSLAVAAAVLLLGNFVIPNYDLQIAVGCYRVALCLLALSGGLLGLSCGIMAALVLLCDQKSFGVPFLSPYAPKTVAREPLFFRGGITGQGTAQDDVNGEAAL